MSSFHLSDKRRAVQSLPVLTFPLQKQPEQRVGRGDGLVVVVIVVDGQQVAVHVGVAHQQLHVGDAVHVLQKAVELIKAPRLRPIQREPTKLCTKLTRKKNKNKVLSALITIRTCRCSTTSIVCKT